MTDSEKSALEAQKFCGWADMFLNFEKTPQKNIFWLDTMKALCSETGNPQDSCRSFHVAGSKGKGSVSEMISSILSEAGFRTGLYTSPHILDFCERIGSPQGYFPPEVYRDAANSLIEKIGGIKAEDLPGGRPVTWFELVTLYGMECFRKAGCTWAVYEVGLGGRLDATNVISPECCCINRIELEHTEYLGDTVEKIAAEKGGIIKEGVPVVIGRQKENSVREIFRQIAKEKNAPIIFADEETKISNLVYKNKLTNVQENIESSCSVDKNTHTNLLGSMDFTLESGYFSRPLNVSLKMLGDFQADNAALASVAVKKTFPDMDEKIIERGLSKASLPGRFEITAMESGPRPVVLDGAHTPSSVSFTVDTFFKVFGKDSEPQLLFACASDKDVEDIAPIFAGKFSHITLTIPGTVKAADLPRAESAFARSGMDFVSYMDFESGIGHALAKAYSDRTPLLVVGSFYLVSEVKKFIREN